MWCRAVFASCCTTKTQKDGLQLFEQGQVSTWGKAVRNNNNNKKNLLVLCSIHLCAYKHMFTHLLLITPLYLHSSGKTPPSLSLQHPYSQLTSTLSPFLGVEKKKREKKILDEVNWEIKTLQMGSWRSMIKKSSWPSPHVPTPPTLFQKAW